MLADSLGSSLKLALVLPGCIACSLYLYPDGAVQELIKNMRDPMSVSPGYDLRRATACITEFPRNEAVIEYFFLVFSFQPVFVKYFLKTPEISRMLL